jgi:hypothetical protein
MSIKKLVAGAKGSSGNSGGKDIADTVNALVDKYQLPKTLLPIRVMQSPPTVSSGTTNNLSTGQRWAATNSANAGTQQFAGSAFSLFRGGYWSAGPAFPDNQGVVSNDLTGNFIPSLVNQASFIHTGSRFSVQVKGLSQILVKVNDEFVSLTPTNIPLDGNFHFVMVDFGSVATRRIDILMYNTRFGGVWTDLTGVIQPAPRRGLKAFVVGDSFAEGSGNESGAIWSWVTYMAEMLGWDDVTCSAVGGTGLIATTGAPKVPFGQRIQRDVLDLMPVDETCLLWISLSVNDYLFTGTQVGAALNSILDIVDSSGKKPIVVISSPTITKGIGDVPPSQREHNNVAKNIATSRGCIFIDDIEQPLNSQFSASRVVTTITANVAANATSLTTAIPLMQGSTYKFADGTSFFVRSVSGNVATVDRVLTAQTSGATVFVRGACYLTGTGRVGSTAGWGICDLAVSSDGAHPTNLGHRLKASVDAALLISHFHQ